MLNMINEFDRKGFIWVVRHSGLFRIKRVARGISSTGDGHFYAVFSVLLLIFYSKGQALFNLLAFSFMVELPVYWLLKNSIRRIRPCHASESVQADFEPSDKFSLPSGHTAAAFVFASGLFIFLPVLGALCLVWACFIGVSRIALAVHYPTDIIAGAGLGYTSVVLAANYVNL